jgi:putative serine protease PepD
VGADDGSDVAVVRISTDKDLPVASLATGVDPTVGQTAIAIGSPFGLQSTVIQGIVSAVGRATDTPGGSIQAIQTDAAINPGNSGGALADRRGRVIGINDSIATGNQNGSGSGGNVGIGFAIPIDLAKSVADQLVAGKTPQAGFLGVSLSEATSGDPGALVTDVTSGSPAASAGIQAGDLITAVDGKTVESPSDLTVIIMTMTPGTKATITVQRDGKTQQVEVTLAERQGN